MNDNENKVLDSYLSVQMREAAEAAQQLAHFVKVYYEALLAEGLDPRIALHLVSEMQQGLFGKERK